MIRYRSRMRGISIAGFVTLSITLALAGSVAMLAGDVWHVGKAADYPNQTASQITVGAKPFASETETEPVFGKKADFNKYGILPVLVVIENRRSKTLDLRDLEVTLVGRKGQHVDPLKPDEVAYVALPAQRPDQSAKLPFPTPKKKNPLNVPGADRPGVRFETDSTGRLCQWLLLFRGAGRTRHEALPEQTERTTIRRRDSVL